jgi:hypothetical protein
MTKPFQFSMRRMMVSVLLVSIGTAAFVWAVGQHDIGLILGLIPSGATLGGGAGLIVRRPILCAICGAVLFPLVAFAYIMANVSC